MYEHYEGKTVSSDELDRLIDQATRRSATRGLGRKPNSPTRSTSTATTLRSTASFSTDSMRSGSRTRASPRVRSSELMMCSPPATRWA
jgi:hypothetical protein